MATETTETATTADPTHPRTDEPGTEPGTGTGAEARAAGEPHAAADPAAPGSAPATGGGAAAPTSQRTDADAEADGDGDAEAAGDDPGADDALPDGEPAAARQRRGFGAGAAAVVGAALGLCSLTGTPLGEMLRDRKQLVGQIQSGGQPGGSAADQINALYGAPWHATALADGAFALLAVVVSALVLAAAVARSAARPEGGNGEVPEGAGGARAWVRAVALGGLVLGVLGLLLAAGMYFGVLAPAPQVPGA